MKIAIKPVVDHPGKTLPYSEFNGFNKELTGVTNPLEALDTFFFDIILTNTFFLFFNMTLVVSIKADYCLKRWFVLNRFQANYIRLKINFVIASLKKLVY